MMAVSKAIVAGLLAAVSVAATPVHHGSVKRQVQELRSIYDFVIIGGGTCGLTVADRLSEAFPDKTVLVVEVGEIEYAPGQFDPPQAAWGGSGAGGVKAGSQSYTSLPIADVKGRTAMLAVGKTVGGSSATNGMFFDRGSRYDYDAWRTLGSPEFDESEHKWDWEGIYPYFKKSTTFTEPTPEVAAKHGYTWDLDAYGGTTPIYSSYPPFLWADHEVARTAWSELGVATARECATGDKEGVCWVPNSQHPRTARRSHAGLGHYADVNTTRTNYDLLVKHSANRVVYPTQEPNDCGVQRPPVVEVQDLVGGRLFNVTARREVIVSAGAINTPAVLQRSGIGPASFLRSAGIDVVIDLPGVGANFQDHQGPGWAWNYTKPLPYWPLATEMSNATFAAEATAAFDAVPADGPYTLAMSTSAIYLSLPNVTTSNADTIVSRIRALAADGAAQHLAQDADYSSAPSMVAGYERQLEVLADLYANPRWPSLESPFATGTGMRAFLLHPLSRGTVRIDASNHSRPVLDFRSASNPVDMDIHVAHVQFLRRMVDTPSMRALGAVEVSPGAEIGADEAKLRDYILDNMTLSFQHPCCTAAMMPRSKGGVVGPDLKVHGAAGLRVVDMSIVPLLPGAHLSATAYAVGEKAADIIIKEWTKL